MHKRRSIMNKWRSASSVRKGSPGDHDSLFGYSVVREYVRIYKRYQLCLARKCRRHKLCKGAKWYRMFQLPLPWMGFEILFLYYLRNSKNRRELLLLNKLTLHTSGLREMQKNPRGLNKIRFLPQVVLVMLCCLFLT